MRKSFRVLPFVLFGVLALSILTPCHARPLSIARIYIEYNESANDLGFHVSLDAEDWEELDIRAPDGTTIGHVMLRARARCFRSRLPSSLIPAVISAGVWLAKESAR